MAQPPYALNLSRFEALCQARGIATRTQFIEQSGIARRTFYAVVDADPTDFKMQTAAFILDMFPGTPFEYLFERTVSVPLVEKVAA